MISFDPVLLHRRFIDLVHLLTRLNILCWGYSYDPGLHLLYIHSNGLRHHLFNDILLSPAQKRCLICI